MRFFILITFLLEIFFCFSQNRNDLLKKINDYKTNTINQASFPEPVANFAYTLKDYFDANGYVFDSKTDSSVTFKIGLKTYAERQFVADKSYRHPLRNNDAKPNFNMVNINLYVTCVLYSQQNKITPQIISSYNTSYTSKEKYNQDVLSGGTLAVPTINNNQYFYNNKAFHFNPYHIKKYLYTAYYRNSMVLPTDIQQQITAYNNQQKKKKKKLIAGRDY